MPGNTEILLASDFSVRSDRPLACAIKLASEPGRRLTILHVASKADLERATCQGRDFAADLRAALPPAASSAEIVVATGSTPETIARTATERGVALIVLGVARHNSLGDYLLGTAVDHVVRNAVTPTLVVLRAPEGPYAALAVATDFSDGAQKAVLAAAALFPAARLSVVHAVQVPYQGWINSAESRAEAEAEASEKMGAFLARPALAAIAARLTPVLVHGAPAEAIFNHVTESGADLLVLGAHGHSGFFHATIGSNAEAMLAASPVDVLMVRE